MKQCPHCGQSKPADLQNYHRQSSKPDGLSSWCKTCRAEFDRRRYLANRDAILARNRPIGKLWYQSHREERIERVMEWKRKRKAANLGAI